MNCLWKSTNFDLEADFGMILRHCFYLQNVYLEPSLFLIPQTTGYLVLQVSTPTLYGSNCEQKEILHFSMKCRALLQI